MSVLLRDTRQKINHILDYKPCSIITMASVSDFSFLVLTGLENRHCDKVLLLSRMVLHKGKLTFFLS